MTNEETKTDLTIHFNLGRFEGFNFRSQCAIPMLLTAAEVVGWDHDLRGEAKFWPTGDRSEVAILFNHRSSVTAAELLDLDRLLGKLGGDSVTNFLRIHHAVNIRGANLATLSRDEVENSWVEVFVGSNLKDLRRQTAYQLFKLYFPYECLVWGESPCEGLIFDPDRFLDASDFSVYEVKLDEQRVALIVGS